MKEYIEREAAEEALLLGMVMTGYQSRAIDCVHYLPAADVREVRRGKWEEDTIDGQFWAFYCSECDAYLPYGLEWKPNFCPNCGTEMRGEENEED